MVGYSGDTVERLIYDFYDFQKLYDFYDFYDFWAFIRGQKCGLIKKGRFLDDFYNHFFDIILK